MNNFAFGTLRSGDPSASTTDRTFTGQKADGTGLLYYNARYYDSTLGVFLSPDTLVPDAGAVVDYNRFLYVRGNPLSLNDPTGHTPGGPNFDLNDWGSSLGWGAGLAAERAGWSTSAPERGLEMALRVAPVTGEFIDGVEALSGTDLSTGEQLSDWERGLTVVGMAVPLVPSRALRQASREIGEHFADLATGQRHHILSNKIMEQLNQHQTLAGIFGRNDMLVQAVNPESHRGYQIWHREYDDQVVEWLEANADANATQFLSFLKGVYEHSSMKERFPGGSMLLDQALDILKD